MSNLWKILCVPMMAAGALSQVYMAAAAHPDNPVNGEIYRWESGLEVWNTRAAQWQPPETFWLDFATHSEGKFWGRSGDYPAYGDVSEHDTLLVEVDGSVCLMYFYHSRWRRAQDVKRWDPEFNTILGCPRVFD